MHNEPIHPTRTFRHVATASHQKRLRMIVSSFAVALGCFQAGLKAADLVWTGDVDGNWDTPHPTGSTVLLPQPSPLATAVTFDNTSTTDTINIPGAVTPSAITVDVTRDLTFAPASGFGINGNIPLRKAAWARLFFRRRIPASAARSPLRQAYSELCPGIKYRHVHGTDRLRRRNLFAHRGVKQQPAKPRSIFHRAGGSDGRDHHAKPFCTQRWCAWFRNLDSEYQYHGFPGIFKTTSLDSAANCAWPVRAPRA
ncbi:hypothetical protein [Ereboglobus luteus]|uniref:hypothetical protein n=1 Tax=Ereboglobus luteus TaxID=1796921 RepID=UPI0012603A4E|nr:hypothetical protein [Ereboglobus luteus]